MRKLGKIGVWQIVGFACLVVLMVIDGDLGWSLAAVFPLATGAVVSGEPLTNDATNESSEELLQEYIDDEICRMRPMSTPIDQLSRQSGRVKKVDSFEVDYYSVDTKGVTSTVTEAYTAPTGEAGGFASAQSKLVTLKVADPDMFDISSTMRVIGIKGFDEDGVTESREDLVLVVVAKDSTTQNPVVMAANGKKIKSSASSYQEGCVPSLEAGTKLLLMGRAATELDAQTPQYSLVPTKEQQLCQIFMMQIEQSTYNKIAKKEVNWNFSDLEEAAVYKMREGVENSYLFGVKRKLFDPNIKGYRYMTGGIWWQAGKSIEYGTAADKQISEDELIDISREVFTGGCGNKKKILFCGSELLANLMKVKVTGIQNEPQSVQLFGLDFTSMKTRFGELLVLLHEQFDQAGMADYGFVLDYEYLTKGAHKPWERTELDLKKAGVRNTDAVVISEASCLYLKYPKAHARIVPKKED